MTKRSYTLASLTTTLSTLTLVSGTLLASNIVSATDDTIVDDVNIIVPTACTLSGTGNTTHNATINPGTYQADIGTTTLKAICNDSNGFAIYAAGYTGSKVGDTNSNKLVGQNTNLTIPTGIGTSGDSQWAMKLATPTSPTPTYPITIASAPNTSGGADASFSAYHIVPNEYTKVAYRLEGTDAGTNATGSTLTTTYAVNIVSTQAADTYSGQVIYTLVHPNNAPAPMAPLAPTDCDANSICYSPNTSDTIGTMTTGTGFNELKAITANAQAGRQDNFGTGTTLIAPNYSREGYGFAGWSPDFDAVSTHEAAVAASDPSMEPIIYGPNQYVTFSTSGTGDADVSTNGLILYPVWIASTGNLQSWSGCSSLTQATYNSTTGKMEATLASMTALTDQRDGNVYTVAKLADGNCWMTENLRLDAENTRGDSNKNLAQGYGTSTTYGNFTGLATSENANFSTTNPPVANSLYSTDGSTANTIQGGESSYYYVRMPRYNNNNTNRSLTASHNGTGSGTYYQWYGYGNYYNWAAAMANIKYFESYSYSASETVGTSLCPFGWRLPYGRNTDNGNTSGGFYYLGTQLGATASSAVSSEIWRSFPNNFVYSGYFDTASADNRGRYGYYWSSTINSMNDSFVLLLNPATLYPGTAANKVYKGISVRCLTQ